MADFKTAPADASVGVKLMSWVDNKGDKRSDEAVVA